MNYVKLGLILVAVSIIADSQAFAFPGSNQNTLKIMHICDSEVATTNSSCTLYNASNLNGLATAMLTPPVNWECEQNPNDPTCDSTPSMSGSNEIHFFVIDVDDKQAKFYVASRNSFGSVALNEIAVSSINQSIADDIYMLESELALAAIKYQFSQNEDGSFTNSLGETVSALLAGGPPSTNSAPSPPNSCQSALAYTQVQDCSGLINGMIIAQNDGAGFLAANIKEFTSNINIAIGAGGFQVSKVITGTFELTFNFKDGAKLVIEVKPGENVAIKLLEDKSFMAGGTTTFTQYFAQANNDGTRDNFTYSGGEVRSLFMGIPQCSNVAFIVSYERTYIVSIGELPDGTRYIISVQLEGSVPQWDSKTICEYNQFGTQ
jgi:hypothetical protein